MALEMNRTFIEEFSSAQKAVHSNALNKGFWEAKLLAEHSMTVAGKATTLSDSITLHNNLAMLALVTTEISEACEAIRHGNPPDDKVPEFSGAEAELADAVIRIMDLCEARGWRLGEAIVAKHTFNMGRPHMHGKKV